MAQSMDESMHKYFKHVKNFKSPAITNREPAKPSAEPFVETSGGLKLQI